MNEEIREQIERLMTLIAQSHEERIKDHTSSVQKDVQSDVQQVKTYVLGLEERITTLEQDNAKLREDLNHVGTVMANLTEQNKSLQSFLETKKKKFWH